MSWISSFIKNNGDQKINLKNTKIKNTFKQNKK